jgi:ATP-dependent DNA ligase
VARPPSGPLWVHEIKHDGYKLMVRRDGLRVRRFTCGGHDWADRFPAIVNAALGIKTTSPGESSAAINSPRTPADLSMRSRPPHHSLQAH